VERSHADVRVEDEHAGAGPAHVHVGVAAVVVCVEDTDVSDLRLAVRAEFDADPPPAVRDWLELEGVAL